MKLYDVTELAVRNLRESIFRNSLTTIGISVGVASLVAMLSLGIGLQQLASRRLQKSGLFDTVLVTPAVTSATSANSARRERHRPKAHCWMRRRDKRSPKFPAWSRLILIFGSLRTCASTASRT